MLSRIFFGLLGNRYSPELIVSTIAINVLALGSSFYSIQLLNRYVSVGLSVTLVTLTVGVVIAIFFEIVLRKMRQKVLFKVGELQETQRSDGVFNAFTSVKYAELSAVGATEKREAIGSAGAFQQAASISNMGALLDFPFALMFFAIAFMLHPLLGLFGVGMSVVALVLGFFNERRQRQPAQEHAEANAKQQQLNQFLLTSGEAVRALPIVEPLTQRWNHIAGGALSSRRQTMSVQNDLQTTVQMMSQILTVLVYSVGAYAVVQGDLTTGALIGANILLSRGFNTASRLSYLADAVLRAKRAESALADIEDMPHEVQGDEGIKPQRFKGQVSVSDLSFGYAGQPVPLFEGLSFEADAGAVVVVSGPNGAGKSTLIKVLMGVMDPSRGLIRYDQIESRQIARDWWRSNIGYVPQEPVFFDGTLRENLALGRDISDNHIMDVAKKLDLETFIANDPKGLDRVLTGADAGLAVGLRRRFAIVRAILTDPPLIFLDEPTEGLDQAGQGAVAKLLNEWAADNKSLVIASNEAFIIRASDRVVDLGVKPTPSVKIIERKSASSND